MYGPCLHMTFTVGWALRVTKLVFVFKRLSLLLWFKYSVVLIYKLISRNYKALFQNFPHDIQNFSILNVKILPAIHSHNLQNLNSVFFVN